MKSKAAKRLNYDYAKMSRNNALQRRFSITMTVTKQKPKYKDHVRKVFLYTNGSLFHCIGHRKAINMHC